MIIITNYNFNNIFSNVFYLLNYSIYSINLDDIYA